MRGEFPLSCLPYFMSMIIRDVAEGVEISYVFCRGILTNDLVISQIALKFVPRLLTDKQK